MIGFSSDKVRLEWAKASVALRLVVEDLDFNFGGAIFVFRILAPCKFENGVHATHRAMDLELRGKPEEIMAACNKVNARFVDKGLNGPVCTMKVNRASFPSGERIDRPHVHVQIPFDWVASPRSFLREHGYTEGTAHD